MNRKSGSVAIASLMLFSCALVGAPGGRAWGEEAIPDPSPMAMAMPEAAKAPAPAWAKPGTRLVYFGASASIPGERTQLVLDPNGKWVNKKTGLGMGEQEVPGSAGAGYTVFQIGHVDRKLVAITGTMYMFDPTTQKCIFSSEGGFVTTVGCAADLWINPDFLKNVREMKDNGMLIVRMPYTVNNHKYNAIRFQTEGSAYVYDLDTGLMVFHTSSAQGAGILTPPSPEGGLAGQGQGSTVLVTGWLMEVKDMQVPWAGAAFPAWVGKFAELNYGGVQSTAIPGAGPLDRPLVAAMKPTARGEGWVRGAWQLAIQSPMGLPPDQSAPDIAYGGATIGGLWIAPEAMAKLRQGQVLDRNNVVGTVTSVSAAGPRQVTISEAGPLHRRDWTYDGASGMLVGFSIQQQNGLGSITHRATLTGQK